MPYIICCGIIMGCCCCGIIIIICGGDMGADSPAPSGCADRTVWAAPGPEPRPGRCNAMPKASNPLKVPGPATEALAAAFLASLLVEMPPRSTKPAKSPNVLLVLAATAGAGVGAEEVKSPKSLSTGGGAG